MTTFQHGLPSPSAVPRDDNIRVTDSQDCFFTIPVSSQDCKRFAFSLPTANLRQPFHRYQWKVLPQGMKNTLCQKFVVTALQKIRDKHWQVYLLPYMNAIPISHKARAYLQEVLKQLISQLSLRWLQKTNRYSLHLIIWDIFWGHRDPPTFRIKAR